MLIAGIDEAGKGPVLGDLVIAVAATEKSREQELHELGARDSKQLRDFERREIYERIKPVLTEYSYVRVPASELNILMVRHSLNEIEAMKIGQLLNGLKDKPEIIVVDSPDVIEANFAQRIKRYYKQKCLIRSEHKADVNHPIVASASVIAKVERDNSIEELKKIHGDLGSGYSHDPKTIEFLKKWVDRHKDLPEFARSRWSTSERILNEKYQTKLDKY